MILLQWVGGERNNPRYGFELATQRGDNLDYSFTDSIVTNARKNKETRKKLESFNIVSLSFALNNQVSCKKYTWKGILAELRKKYDTTIVLFWIKAPIELKENNRKTKLFALVAVND